VRANQTPTSCPRRAGLETVHRRVCFATAPWRLRPGISGKISHLSHFIPPASALPSNYLRQTRRDIPPKMKGRGVVTVSRSAALAPNPKTLEAERKASDCIFANNSLKCLADAGSLCSRATCRAFDFWIQLGMIGGEEFARFDNAISRSAAA
jgi:hypothetical protein